MSCRYLSIEVDLLTFFIISNFKEIPLKLNIFSVAHTRRLKFLILGFFFLLNYRNEVVKHFLN